MRANEIAKYLIANNHDEPRNTKSGNMKLQKLMFFAHMIHLAQFNEPLLDDELYAFDQGTVVENIRLKYCNYCEEFIREACGQSSFNFNEKVLETLKLTLRIFGDVNAQELSILNHQLISWKDAWKHRVKGYKSSSIIRNIHQKDIDKFKAIINMAIESVSEDDKYIKINNIDFYYNPNEISITDSIIDYLKNFRGEDSAYSIYMDSNAGLVVY